MSVTCRVKVVLLASGKVWSCQFYYLLKYNNIVKYRMSRRQILLQCAAEMQQMARDKSFSLRIAERTFAHVMSGWRMHPFSRIAFKLNRLLDDRNMRVLGITIIIFFKVWCTQRMMWHNTNIYCNFSNCIKPILHDIVEIVYHLVIYMQSNLY